MTALRRSPECAPAVAGSPRSALDSPGVPAGPQNHARGPGALEARRCRQNRGSFRRSFASRVGRGLAALRQRGACNEPADTNRSPRDRTPAMRVAALGRSLAPTAGACDDRGCGAGRVRPDRKALRARPAVERAASSDMLERAYNAGISRGFEFSAIRIRRLDPGSEACAEQLPYTLPYTVRRRSAERNRMARTESGFGARRAIAPHRPVGAVDRFRRSIRLTGPYARVSRTARHATASARIPRWRTRT